MSHPNRYCSHVVLAGRIYVVGGYDEDNHASSSVECYDPLADTWETLAPMNHGRVEPAVIALNGFIYVFGGGHPTDRVERFNPEENSWTVVSIISRPDVFWMQIQIQIINT